ncbi:50S ribosomal protein L10 [Blattabacterium cuenoti]|uniref:50S ribosomal protein L10 n=1 Tax=Blattabacterium cuenoti TaxID=1653831 RepID=UPI00163BDD02|nr:50S ribosomal protein L10 [Blattabacterium cuenoti]
MNKENKKKELLKLVYILSNNETIYLIDISNLNSNQVSILRKNFHKHSIKMRIVKNTLLKKAINKTKNQKFDSFFSILNGNTTLLFSNFNVANIASKIIKDFHIQEQTDKPYLKVAYAQESFYFGGNKDLNVLIHLKSKEDIIIEIFNTLQFSIKDVISSFMDSTKYKICGLLEALSSKK